MNRICHHIPSQEIIIKLGIICVLGIQPNRGVVLYWGIRGARKTCEYIKLIDDRF